MRHIHSILPIVGIFCLLIVGCDIHPVVEEPKEKDEINKVKEEQPPSDNRAEVLLLKVHKTTYDKNSSSDRKKMDAIKKELGIDSIAKPISKPKATPTPRPTPVQDDRNYAIPPEQEVRTALISEAKKHIGIRERGTNRGPEIDRANDLAGADLGSAWCASIQYKISHDVTKNLRIKRLYPRTARAIIMGKQFSLREKDPKPGDTFYVGKYSHTGMFESWSKKGMSCTTLEGNTSPAGATPGQDREGDGFYNKQRLKASLMYGADWVTNRIEKL